MTYLSICLGLTVLIYLLVTQLRSNISIGVLVTGGKLALMFCFSLLISIYNGEMGWQVILLCMGMALFHSIIDECFFICPNYAKRARVWVALLTALGRSIHVAAAMYVFLYLYTYVSVEFDVYALIFFIMGFVMFENFVKHYERDFVYPVNPFIPKEVNRKFLKGVEFIHCADLPNRGACGWIYYECQTVPYFAHHYKGDVVESNQVGSYLLLQVSEDEKNRLHAYYTSTHNTLE